jgi:hypothetical protein
VPTADCRLPIELAIGDWLVRIGLRTADWIEDWRFKIKLRINLAIRQSIRNPHSTIKSAIGNPLRNRELPIANSIGSLQSAVGNR